MFLLNGVPTKEEYQIKKIKKIFNNYQKYFFQNPSPKNNWKKIELGNLEKILPRFGFGNSKKKVNFLSDSILKNSSGGFLEMAEVTKRRY